MAHFQSFTRTLHRNRILVQSLNALTYSISNLSHLWCMVFSVIIQFCNLLFAGKNNFYQRCLTQKIAHFQSSTRTLHSNWILIKSTNALTYRLSNLSQLWCMVLSVINQLCNFLFAGQNHCYQSCLTQKIAHFQPSTRTQHSN